MAVMLWLGAGGAITRRGFAAETLLGPRLEEFHFYGLHVFAVSWISEISLFRIENFAGTRRFALILVYFRLLRLCVLGPVKHSLTAGCSAE